MFVLQRLVLQHPAVVRVRGLHRRGREGVVAAAHDEIVQQAVRKRLAQEYVVALGNVRLSDGAVRPSRLRGQVGAWGNVTHAPAPQRREQSGVKRVALFAEMRHPEATRCTRGSYATRGVCHPSPPRSSGTEWGGGRRGRARAGRACPAAGPGAQPVAHLRQGHRSRHDVVVIVQAQRDRVDGVVEELSRRVRLHHLPERRDQRIALVRVHRARRATPALRLQLTVSLPSAVDRKRNVEAAGRPRHLGVPARSRGFVDGRGSTRAWGSDARTNPHDV